MNLSTSLNTTNFVTKAIKAYTSFEMYILRCFGKHLRSMKFKYTRGNLNNRRIEKFVRKTDMILTSAETKTWNHNHYNKHHAVFKRYALSDFWRICFTGKQMTCRLQSLMDSNSFKNIRQLKNGIKPKPCSRWWL